jgi:hypothetical protein
MPKIAQSAAACVSEFGSVFEYDGTNVACTVCLQKLVRHKRSELLQHISTMKHQKALRKASDVEQAQAAADFGDKKLSTFCADLCKTLLEADIPLNKLAHPSFRQFIEKYTKRRCPVQSTLRKNYIYPIYNQKMQTIREEIGESKIWVQIDETTDSMGRAVANVVVGTLDPLKTYKSFLLTSEVLSKANSDTISQLFMSALSLLWPSGIRYDFVLLYLSDAAAYMVKSAKILNEHFPRMIHVTCIVHGLHRVAEEVRAKFPDVDALISNVKKIFLKCNSRQQLFKDTLDIPLPPQPVVTRWGTWIEAAVYYAENFTAIKTFVCEKLHSEDAVSIRLAQSLFTKDDILNDLLCIATHFRILPNTIKKLEEKGRALHETLEIFAEMHDWMINLDGVKLNAIREKFKAVCTKNSGLSIMQSVLSMLKGEYSADGPVTLGQISDTDLLCLKSAPLVTCEVERSFSRYKAIFRDDRHSFKFDTLKMILVIACNSN